MHALHGLSTSRPVVDQNTLSDHFHRYLEAEIAVNNAQRREAHQLRYEVYCLERGYEDPAGHSDGLEKDEFDLHSVHSLVRHRSSGMVAGVVRLILQNPSKLNSLLPIELHCGHAFNQAVLADFEFPRTAIAEVSRFAVSKRLIARAGQVRTIPTSGGAEEPGNIFIREDVSQCLPHISLGLIAMLFVSSVQHQITHWYAAMEPSLSRLLGASGVEFTPIGPVIDYHGKRQPMIANVRGLLDRIYHKRYEFFQLIERLGGVPSDFVAGEMHSSQIHRPRQIFYSSSTI
jgi:N-acyl amino acid synthase of PEP-CTERM/exosortase system